MIYCLNARKPRDIYASHIVVYGELDSIWNLLMTLAAVYGTQLEISAKGPDEGIAVEAITRLFESKFDECYH